MDRPWTSPHSRRGVRATACRPSDRIILPPSRRTFVKGLAAGGASESIVVDAFEELSGVELPGEPFPAMGDRVLAWDLPAPPNYRRLKRDLFLLIEPRWAPFFEDEDSAIDWRLVGWGGVFIDDRPDATAGQLCPRGCIPALDQPAVTDAEGGSWYPDDDLVFGIVIGREARAYPKNVMEVHEMVNDTLGGRSIAIPYCTLCLSAQAYFTDDVEGFRPLLRTSGLLSRSNKFMYDITTFSAVDTFTGEAISGPLFDVGVRLNQTTIVTSTWAAWRAAHPDTTIIAEDGGIGRSYPRNPLRGRDDAGPIFPVGDVDPRLGVHDVVSASQPPMGHQSRSRWGRRVWRSRPVRRSRLLGWRCSRMPAAYARSSTARRLRRMRPSGLRGVSFNRERCCGSDNARYDRTGSRRFVLNLERSDRIGWQGLSVRPDGTVKVLDFGLTTTWCGRTVRWAIGPRLRKPSAQHHSAA